MIPPGHKYATISLNTGMSALRDAVDLAPGLTVARSAPAVIPDHWTRSLGSFALASLAEADVHITAVAPAKASEVLDEENERLRSRVEHVYAGLLIGTPGVRVLYGRSLTGAHRPNDEIDLRSTYQLLNVNDVLGTSREMVLEAKHFRQAHHLGERLRQQRRAENRDGHGDFGRIKRCISALYSCVESNRLDHRLHQAVRVIEGIMGAGHEDFGKAHVPRLREHVLSDAPEALELPTTLYKLRSKIEHLWGATAAVVAADLAPAGAVREAFVRFSQATHAAEFLAHALLGHVVQDEALWPCFSDDAKIPGFWKQDAHALWSLRLGRAVLDYQRTFDLKAAEQAFDDQLEDAAFEAKFHT